MLKQRYLKLSVLILATAMAGLSSTAQSYTPSDDKATAATKALYAAFAQSMKKGIMFGHQDDMAYGVDWKYEAGRSDVKDVCGDYPAVFGWELGHLEIDESKNLDDVPFDSMRAYIQRGYAMGGVITISWHLRNPVTGKSAWDPETGTVAAILPGGTHHAKYNSWLDKVAGFLQSLTTENGTAIPVVFRPYHEWSGNWFWWGKQHCTPDEFKALFRYTVNYLRGQKNLHHLLIAFNPDRFESIADYLERYPGNDWVDVLGFDIYQRNENQQQFITDVQKMHGMLAKICADSSKVPAITELGYNTIPYANWWTETLLPALSAYPAAWVLTWRNAGTKHDGTLEFFGPHRQHSSTGNFREFYASPRTIFLRDAAAMKLYQIKKQ